MIIAATILQWVIGLTLLYLGFMDGAQGGAGGQNGWWAALPKWIAATVIVVLIQIGKRWL